MQEPKMDPRRVGAMGTLLQKLNTVTRHIQVVETIPFDKVLIINFEIAMEGFKPSIKTAISSVSEIRDLCLVLCLFAFKEEMFPVLSISNINDRPTVKIPVGWVVDWKILTKEELPLTMDYEVKYDTYKLLFQ